MSLLRGIVALSNVVFIGRILWYALYQSTKVAGFFASEPDPNLKRLVICVFVAGVALLFGNFLFLLFLDRPYLLRSLWGIANGLLFVLCVLGIVLVFIEPQLLSTTAQKINLALCTAFFFLNAFLIIKRAPPVTE